MQPPPTGPDRSEPTTPATDATEATESTAARRAQHQSRRQVLRTGAAFGAAAATLVTASEAAAAAPAAARSQARKHGAAGGRTALGTGRHDQHGGHRHHPADQGDGAGGGEAHRLQLQPTGAEGLMATTLTLRPEDFHREAGAWVSREILTSVFTMVALTWDADSRRAEPGVRIRPEGGRPRPWIQLPASEDGPDRVERGDAAPFATALAWVGAAEAVAVRVTGTVPKTLRLHLVRSQQIAADRGAARHRLHAGAATPPAAAAGRRLGRGAVLPNPVPQPTILSRAAWGANESWRSATARYNDTIKQVHIHHTATNNGYGDADVPALIRGMYYYHTHTLGWSDIAYNFLVDIFGRIWEGRAGGIDQPVRGAHTLGFNAQSTGFSVIGNYQDVQPSAAVLQSLASLAAWKLTPYGRDPLATISVTSEGSDKFSNGRQVVLPVMDGHRDTNDTACPGNYLYVQIPAIRNLTKVGMGQGQISISTPFAVSGTPLVGQTLTVVPGAYSPADATVGYVWQRDGADIPGAVGVGYLVTTDDVGHALSVAVNLSRDGYTSTSQGVATAAKVMTSPAMKLHGVGHLGGRMRVKVKIDAPGVRAAGGEMVITANLKGVKHRRTVKVGKGVAIAQFLELPAGRYFVSAAYSGSPRIQAGRVHVHVKVPRHPQRKDKG